VVVTLRQLTDEHRAAVLALPVTPSGSGSSADRYADDGRPADREARPGQGSKRALVLDAEEVGLEPVVPVLRSPRFEV